MQNQIKQVPCHIPEKKLAEMEKGTGGVKVGANRQFQRISRVMGPDGS